MIDKRILALGLMVASIATASYLYGAQRRTQQQRHAAGQSKLEMVQEAREITAELNAAGSADAAAQALPTGPQLTKLKTNILSIPNPTHKAAYTGLENQVKKTLKNLAEAVAEVTDKPALQAKAAGLKNVGIPSIKKASQALITALEGGAPGGDPDAAAKAQVKAIIGKNTDAATKDTIWGHRARAEAEKLKIDNLIDSFSPEKAAALNAAITTAKDQHDNYDEGYTKAQMQTQVGALDAVDVDAANNLRTACRNFANTLSEKFAVLNVASTDYIAPVGGGDPDAAEKTALIGDAGTAGTIRGEWQLAQLQVDELAIKDAPAGKKATAAFNALKEGETRYNALRARKDADLNAMNVTQLENLRDDIAGYKTDLTAANASVGAPYFEDIAGGGGDAGDANPVFTDAIIDALQNLEITTRNTNTKSDVTIKLFGISATNNLKKVDGNKKLSELDAAARKGLFFSTTVVKAIPDGTKAFAAANHIDQGRTLTEAKNALTGLDTAVVPQVIIDALKAAAEKRFE